MAERVGFEPTVEFPLHTLSKRAPSTTRTSLRIIRISGLGASGSAQNPNCVTNCARPPNVPRSLNLQPASVLAQHGVPEPYRLGPPGRASKYSRGRQAFGRLGDEESILSRPLRPREDHALRCRFGELLRTAPCGSGSRRSGLAGWSPWRSASSAVGRSSARGRGCSDSNRVANHDRESFADREQSALMKGHGSRAVPSIFHHVTDISGACTAYTEPWIQIASSGSRCRSAFTTRQ
jgi:hypothetical protein